MPTCASPLQSCGPLERRWAPVLFVGADGDLTIAGLASVDGEAVEFGVRNIGNGLGSNLSPPTSGVDNAEGGGVVVHGWMGDAQSWCMSLYRGGDEENKHRGLRLGVVVGLVLIMPIGGGLDMPTESHVARRACVEAALWRGGGWDGVVL